MYAQELAKSLKPATTAAVGGVAVLTWFFSAMQCSKEYCYTTDNPITQVALAGTLAVATVMAATSAPVVKAVTPYAAPITEKINQAKTYLEGVFSSKKTAEVKTVDAALTETVENSAKTPTEQKAALPLTGSDFFTPKNDSVQANASETPASPYPSLSPSPTNLS